MDISSSTFICRCITFGIIIGFYSALACCSFPLLTFSFYFRIRYGLMIGSHHNFHLKNWNDYSTPAFSFLVVCLCVRTLKNYQAFILSVNKTKRNRENGKRQDEGRKMSENAVKSKEIKRFDRAPRIEKNVIRIIVVQFLRFSIKMLWKKGS